MTTRCTKSYYHLHIHDTFVTTLKVAFFSSVSEDVTVTRRSSGLGVDGLKQTASKKIYFEHLNLFHRKKDNNENNNISITATHANFYAYVVGCLLVSFGQQTLEWEARSATLFTCT